MDQKILIFAVVVIIVCVALVIADKKDYVAKITKSLDVVEEKGPDGQSYWVVKGPTQKVAATLLSEVVQMSENLLKQVAVSFTQDDCMCDDAEQLLMAVNRRTIEFKEIRPQKTGGAVAYNVDKGKTIGLCLFGDDQETPVGFPALFSVVIHELAHMMDPSIAPSVNGHSIHSDRFKKNEKFLMKTAIDMQIIPPGGAVGDLYCGITIPDPSTAT